MVWKSLGDLVPWFYDVLVKGANEIDELGYSKYRYFGLAGRVTYS